MPRQLKARLVNEELVCPQCGHKLYHYDDYSCEYMYCPVDMLAFDIDTWEVITQFNGGGKDEEATD